VKNVPADEEAMKQLLQKLKPILLRDGIPRNPAGKILKRVLKQEVQAV
jgi:acyl-CoA synthetase (AMP-forming)/AMP-acid ligase II